MPAAVALGRSQPQLLTVAPLPLSEQGFRHRLVGAARSLALASTVENVPNPPDAVFADLDRVARGFAQAPRRRRIAPLIAHRTHSDFPPKDLPHVFALLPTVQRPVGIHIHRSVWARSRVVCA